MSQKKVYTEVEKVVVCHGLGNTVLKSLTLGEGLGKGEARESFLG